MRAATIGAAGIIAAVAASGMSVGSTHYPADVAAALDSAGANRAELESVLEHYASDPDTLKLQAAYYLIGNMEGHSYVTYKLCDTAGVKVDFEVLDYSDLSALEAASDSLEGVFGKLDFKRDSTIDDCKVITGDYLITQIDYAFRAWRERPWARRLSFEQFREYVLPYRGSNEPLEAWREQMWEKYAGLEKKMADSTDPIEAAALINEDVKSWFGFDQRYYYHPTDQGLSEMVQSGLGRCEDMTNLSIYAMRAVGLAVTSDYTPCWANAGNNHAWNAIVAPDGRVMPFMGAEANPGQYSLANKYAKVYRKTFGKQAGNLVLLNRKQEKLPGWLGGKNYVDVTEEYGPVEKVTVSFGASVPDSVDIAYICVFNSGEWRPVDWAPIDGGAATFTKLAADIVYLPAFYLNEKIAPAGSPRILEKDGAVRELPPDTINRVTASLTEITSPKLAASTIGIEKAYVTPGRVYELMYWQDGWQSAGKATAGEGPIVFQKVPAGGLYWLVADDSDREERVFTLDPATGAQAWW